MTTATEADVVDLLIEQHMRIRELFVEVAAATGDTKAEAFSRLVHLLAVHETAEEQLVHPMARGALDGGDEVVDQRLDEEHRAKELLSELEKCDPGTAEFDTLLAELRVAVLAHANAEEAHEFRYLRRTVDPEQLRALAGLVRAAEATAPTHPHAVTEESG